MKISRVLALTRYEHLGASSRLRFLQYARFLKEAGLDAQFCPFFGNDYIDALHSKSVSIWSVLKAYCHRLFVLFGIGGFNVLWVEKEVLPFIPAWVELFFIPKSVALVVDYDDAWFHRYDRHRSCWVRLILGKKIDRIMARADLVVAGNEYLAQRAYAAGAKDVRLLPTVVCTQRYQPVSRKLLQSPLVVGWIGSPGTARYLEPLFPVAEMLCQEFAVRFIAVGANGQQVAGSTFEAVPWSEGDEVDLLSGFDIGVMPLPDESWERGKCGYKLVQYMASGLPMVASPVGINTQIVDHGRNGYLATSPDEWYQALRLLLESDEQRAKFGEAGRLRAVAEYSLDVTGPKLCEYLVECAKLKGN